MQLLSAWAHSAPCSIHQLLFCTFPQPIYFNFRRSDRLHSGWLLTAVPHHHSLGVNSYQAQSFHMGAEVWWVPWQQTLVSTRGVQGCWQLTCLSHRTRCLCFFKKEAIQNARGRLQRGFSNLPWSHGRARPDLQHGGWWPDTIKAYVYFWKKMIEFLG